MLSQIIYVIAKVSKNTIIEITTLTLYKCLVQSLYNVMFEVHKNGNWTVL